MDHASPTRHPEASLHSIKSPNRGIDATIFCQAFSPYQNESVRLRTDNGESLGCHIFDKLLRIDMMLGNGSERETIWALESPFASPIFRNHLDDSFRLHTQTPTYPATTLVGEWSSFIRSPRRPSASGQHPREPRSVESKISILWESCCSRKTSTPCPFDVATQGPCPEGLEQQIPLAAAPTPVHRATARTCRQRHSIALPDRSVALPDRLPCQSGAEPT